MLLLSGCVKVGDLFAAQLAVIMADDGPIEQKQDNIGDGFESFGVSPEVTADATADAQHGLQLREVNLSGCKALSDVGVGDIGRALETSTTLETLVLQGCVNVTDRGISAIADGLRYSPGLTTLNLSWVEELTDSAAEMLANGVCQNHRLSSLLLSCCVKFTDEAAKSFARALDTNRALTTLDLSWCVELGEPALAAFTQAMMKNRDLTALHLTGCKCMRFLAAGDESGDGSSSRSVRGRRGASQATPGGSAKDRAAAGPTLLTLLQRNRRRPAKATTLAMSALGSDGQNDVTRRDMIASSNTELMRTLRAAIVNGAAMYNAEDADGCFKLFQQTAESVVASTRSPAVADALLHVTGVRAPAEMQKKLWVLRSAFDSLLDELSEKEEADAVAAAPGRFPMASRPSPPTRKESETASAGTIGAKSEL